jgi:hypothetical protein
VFLENHQEREPCMSEITTIGLDLAKHVFQVHGVDAQRSLPLHWDIDPARVMRPRFADSIRASSPSGLREQAGHMTASDFCAAREVISCQAGAIHA